MPGTMRLSQITRQDFQSELDTLVTIYAEAMRAEPAYLPSRISVMERHAGYPGFRALVATDGSASHHGASHHGASHHGASHHGASHHGESPGTPIVGFSYGFHGAPGQWWHDVVSTGLIAASGPLTQAEWMADTFEVAELHVLPAYQKRGAGRGMLLALTAGQAERTTVLSTQDHDSPARHLYRSLGFADLLTGFIFPGGAPPYAVMGARLPLGPRPSSS